MNLRQAAQQALESMDDHMYRADTHEFYEAKEALRTALAEPEESSMSEALRLAAWCETFNHNEMEATAAELRRLHALNDELGKVLNKIAAWNDGNVGPHMDEPFAAYLARAALAKVGESK